MAAEFKIAGSILSADLLNLGSDIEKALQAGVDVIHFDVMDYHFVPNLTFGPDFLRQIRARFPKAILDVHLMVAPLTEQMIIDFAKAGASWISFHPEATPHVHRMLNLIRSLNCKAGLALNPGTAPQALSYLWDELDFVLVMTVNPGFGGQKLIPSTLNKVSEIKQLAEQQGRKAMIEVDGGVNGKTIAACAKAGAEVFVVGSACFGREDKQAAVAELHQALAEL